jgi:hypothetical protein
MIRDRTLSMTNRSLLAAGLVLLTSGTALGEQQCAANPVDRSVTQMLDFYVDGYGAQSDVEAYRVATGLGYAAIYPSYGGEGDVSPKPWIDALKVVAPERTAEAEALTRYSACRFIYAAETLRRRLQQLGANHPYVHHWIGMKAATFARCNASYTHRSSLAASFDLPAELATDDLRVAELQQDDREYEIAVRAYYRNDVSAMSLFDAVAASKSEHRGAAMYMGALLRLQTGPDSAVEEALNIADSIIKDESLAATHRIAKQLVGYVSYYSSDVRHRKALLASVFADATLPLDEIRLDPNVGGHYSRALGDIDWFRNAFAQAWFLPDGAMPSPTVRALQELAQEQDIARWLIASAAVTETFEQENWLVAANAVDARRQFGARLGAMEETTTLPWIPIRAATDLMPVADVWTAVQRSEAAVQACPSAPEQATLARLLYHASRRTLIAGDTRKFITELKRYAYIESDHARQVVYDAIAYLMAVNRKSDARRVRDSLAPLAFGGDRQAYSRARFQVPSLLAVLAEDRKHVVAALGDRYFYEFDLLNLLSIEAMHELAKEGGVRHDIRAALSRAAWAREYALRERVRPKSTQLMLELNPAIAALWSATDLPQAASHRELLNVLRTPRIGVLVNTSPRVDAAPGYEGTSVQTLDIRNHSDNNWWCAMRSSRIQQSLRIQLANRLALVSGYLSDGNSLPEQVERHVEDALTGGWITQHISRKELEQLAQVESAPRLLSRKVLAWASQDDVSSQGLDEALHRAVVMTRYGCQRQGGHGEYSKASYRVLHKRFPESPWAKKTPFWFDCDHFYFGCAGRR